MSQWACGKGWYPIVDALEQDLRALGWTGTLRVKEKYGVLDCVARPDGVPLEQHKAFYTRVRVAEGMSYGVCEDCGADGESHNVRGWDRTLCGECALVAGVPVPLVTLTIDLDTRECTIDTRLHPVRIVFLSDGQVVGKSTPAYVNH